MSERVSRYLGTKFSCPGCHSKLKFRRPPASRSFMCPHCRRKLRLQDRKAAAGRDDELREAIQSLASWKLPEQKTPYTYAQDPQLDAVTCPSKGVWKFNQPWPEGTGEIVYKRANVTCDRGDAEEIDDARRIFMNGTFRRLTVARTSRVEEMEITGHWWDREQPQEAFLGILPRPVVRDINKVIGAKHFAARIDTVELVEVDGEELLALYVDVAIHDAHDSTRSLLGVDQTKEHRRG